MTAGSEVILFLGGEDAPGKGLDEVKVEGSLEPVETKVARLGTGGGARGCCWKLRNGSRFKASILELLAASSLLGVFPGVFGAAPAP